MDPIYSGKGKLALINFVGFVPCDAVFVCLTIDGIPLGFNDVSSRLECIGLLIVLPAL